MIPLLAEIRIRTGKHRNLSLVGVPLFILWLVLLPFAILLLPFFVLACLFGQVNPLRAIAVFWQVFASLSGTHVEINDNASSVLVRLS